MTFVEIALAVLILSLAIVPMVSLLITETRETRLSRDRIVASHLASNILERFRMEPVETLSVALDTMEAGRDFVASDPLLTPDPLPEGYKAYLDRFERFALFELDEGAGGRKGTLKAIVRWSEKGFPRELSMGTVLVDSDFPGGTP